MSHLLIFGLGYTAHRLATRLRAEGWRVTGITRTGRNGTLAWGDASVEDAIERATHILSSVPPGQQDPVLALYGQHLQGWKGAWLGYLSSTGIYGDTGGAWVDETSPPARTVRQNARAQADASWCSFSPRAPVHVFRLPGIYGPFGRSALDRVREGRAHRIDLEASGLTGHVFSRVHVDDIVQTLIASMAAPADSLALYNVSDDMPTPGNVVTEYACDLLGLPYPPLLPLLEAGLSPLGMGFYTSGSRRVANGKIKRELGITLRYPGYREGLLACLNEEQS